MPAQVPAAYDDICWKECHLQSTQSDLLFCQAVFVIFDGGLCLTTLITLSIDLTYEHF